jgi:hypothetical protein
LGITSELKGSILPKGMGRKVNFIFSSTDSEGVFETANCRFFLHQKEFVLLDLSLSRMTIVTRNSSTLELEFLIPGYTTINLKPNKNGLRIDYEFWLIPFEQDPIIYQGFITVVESLVDNVLNSPVVLENTLSSNLGLMTSHLGFITTGFPNA